MARYWCRVAEKDMGLLLLGNYVNSKAHDMFLKDKYFMTYFLLTDEAEYDDKSENILF